MVIFLSYLKDIDDTFPMANTNCVLWIYGLSDDDNNNSVLCVERKCNNQNYCYNIERKTVE